MKAGEHGPDELYDKFMVYKTKNVLPYGPTVEDRPDLNMFRASDELTHKEFVFVLRPEADDSAAVEALFVYADFCEATYPGLARDIRKKLQTLGLERFTY